MIEKKTLILIVLAQFAGTSLWFAGNAVLPDLQASLGLNAEAPGFLTTAVQLGFITGTLVFAFLAVADRFSPSGVFLVCALAGAATNLAVLVWAHGLYSLLALRMCTGFMLAGIYPVGMKISADYHREGLGKALGFLLGALVLGTAFPHFLRAATQSLPWQYVIVGTSACAAAGGFLLYGFVPDGPYRKRNKRPQLSAFFKVFSVRDFRSAALGYFGHMWELYTFWAFVPVMFALYGQLHPDLEINISLWSFRTIAVGSIGCVAGGYVSRRLGSARVAFYALAVSGLCCLLAPWSFHLPFAWFAALLLCWGLTVIADSPQFSTLIAKTAPQEYVGSALTLVNCIGFSLTIVSIQTINFLITRFGLPEALFLTAAGPAFGLAALWRLLRR